jgi:hypothetical protein
MLEDIETADFVTPINVLRCIVANLAATVTCPEGVCSTPGGAHPGASAPTVRTPHDEPTPVE